MPRPRFRLRTLMVIVVLVAAAIGIAVESQRQQLRDQYFAQARDHAESAVAEDGLARDYDGRTDYYQVSRLGGGVDKITYSSQAPVHRRLAEWHRLMERKYRRASRAPWLPIEPDPPMPQ